MPLLDRQKRTAEIGIIRIGTSRARDGGKPGRTPVKLDRLRFTSRSEQSIRAIADTYGGEARPWVDGAPTAGQWEVITEAREIPVAVPPGERKCDGVQDQLNGVPCVCSPERRACKPHSRLRVILPDIPGGGTWRLNTSGENAADELAGVAETMAMYSARGMVLPAVLRLEQRQTLTKEGARHYVVPVLQLTSTVRELASMPSGQVMLPPAPANLRAIEAPTAHAAPADDSPQGFAARAEVCSTLAELNELGRKAHGMGLMDEFVESKYAPVEGEAIELVEVFRGRQATLSGGQP